MFVLFFKGDGEIARSASLANGGFEVNDTVDGSGFARVATVETGSFTPVHTGFSAPPTGDIRWTRVGSNITLQCDFSVGTSNATTWTITNWPAALQVTEDVKFAIFGVVDNTATLSQLGSVVLTNGSGIATFRSSMTSGWPASGSKGLLPTNNGPAQMMYTIY